MSKHVSCEMLLNCRDEKYSEAIRKFQGCPTIAVSPKGRIFMGWYAGGTREPHMGNYNLLVYSDDDGKTWSEPVLIIPSSIERNVHALDIQLWISPEGKLYVFWVQNDALSCPKENICCYEDGFIETHWIDGYIFGVDWAHAQWLSICEDPDADTLAFSEPRYLGIGFLRCKPTVLSDGRWFLCNYDQLTKSYGYTISTDQGETYTRYYGAKKIDTPHDETMVYERKDGSIHMLARTGTSGYIAETVSVDGGKTWSETVNTDICNPNTRLYISRTPSGRIILVNNDSTEKRVNMTVYLSDDDGETFLYKKCIYEDVSSYPDVDFYDGKIYLTFDHGRTRENEILLCKFTEDDIINDKDIEVKIVSKPAIAREE